jgi:hypothetical protein
MTRSQERTTSVAVSGDPSLNRSPGRIRNEISRPPSPNSHDAASAGWTSAVASSVVKPSYTCDKVAADPASDVAAGSHADGAAPTMTASASAGRGDGSRCGVTVIRARTAVPTMAAISSTVPTVPARPGRRASGLGVRCSSAGGTGALPVADGSPGSRSSIGWESTRDALLGVRDRLRSSPAPSVDEVPPGRSQRQRRQRATSPWTLGARHSQPSKCVRGCHRTDRLSRDHPGICNPADM